MNISQRLRKLADSTGLDAFGDEIRAIADEMDACGSAGTQSDPQAGLTFTGATQPAEVTDADIDIVINRHWGDACITVESIRQFSRAILALRPVQVPMDKQDAWDNSPVNSDWEAVDAYLQGIEDAESHHGITAQAKKE